MGIKEPFTSDAEVQDVEEGAAAYIEERYARLGEEYESAKRERNRLRNAAPPRTEILQALVVEVDKLAAAWDAEWGPVLLRGLGPGMETPIAGGPDTLPRPRVPNVFLDKAFTGAALVGLFDDHMKKRITRALRGIDYVEGPAQADRERLVAEAEDRLRAAEDAHTQFAEKFGKPLLSAVAQRRNQDAEKRKRDEVAHERQRRVEAENDARHAKRYPSALPSPYLVAENATRHQLRRELDDAGRDK